MGDENKSGFTLEEILREQREKREATDEKAAPAPQKTGPAQPSQKPRKAAQPPQGQRDAARRSTQQPLQAPTAKDGAPQAGREENEAPLEDINSYATGNIRIPKGRGSQAAGGRRPGEEPEAPKGKKENKKKGGGLFGRKKKVPDYVDSDDLYYGIQIKPIDEYRKGYNAPTGEFNMDDTYTDLFDNSRSAIDNEVEENFLRLQKERRSRVAAAVKSAGMDREALEQELGVVAPMPLTSFAADPYTKQHGIENEGKGDMTRFQKAQMDDMKKNQQTMEIKLDVESNTMMLKKVRDIPVARDNREVSEETVGRILKAAPADAGLQEAQWQAPPVDEAPQRENPQRQSRAQRREDAGAGKREPLPKKPQPQTEPPEPEALPEAESLQEPEKDGAGKKKPRHAVLPEDSRTAKNSGGDGVIEGREPQAVPQISSIYEYRSRGMPAHIINADVLQSALLTEAENLAANNQPGGKRSKKAPKPTKLQQPEPLWEDIDSGAPENRDVYDDAENPGSIDDYTGPEDAASISAELKGDMRDISLRMMITGACTVVLTLINLIFGGTFQSKTELGSAPVIYIVLTVLFLGASIAVCYRTITNGLRALLAFNANSDSGVAVAAAGALIQTISALFYTDAIVEGSQHLYAVVLTAVLFVNAVGKLTMLRRIHSNFRFVTSREQKYAVRLYDDHNTALQMTQDVVAEQPLVAYQRKTNFLKRFLELSYRPDPAETSSQMIAPIALISALLLCVVSMLVTKSVPSAISALTAALIVGVAAVNMLAVNLPMSRLAKVARRAGAMLVGYEAVQEFGNTNAIIVDADDLFPTGTVVLNGIKTYGPRAQIEEAILAASALVSEIGGPLAGVFEQVINENEDELPAVEKAAYEDGYGISGYVEGKRIFLGNRELLAQHKIEPPARSDETEYTAANRQMLYIAVDDTPVAMFVLTYTADRRRKNELQRMEESGISLVVRATDPNITKQLIARLFGIDGNSVKVLKGMLAEEYRSLVKAEAPRSDAILATKGRMESMISVISACIHSKSGVSLIVALQTAAAVLGFVLVAFLACFGAISKLSAFGLFLFELAWLLVILLLPKLRK